MSERIIHYIEMNDKIFDNDVNVWDHATNLMERLSFHLFHGQRDFMEPYLIV
jgi:hypothetical protein